jgi:hypothetical protein
LPILAFVLAQFLLSLALIQRRLRLSLARFFGSPVRLLAQFLWPLALPASIPGSVPRRFMWPAIVLLDFTFSGTIFSGTIIDKRFLFPWRPARC